MSSTSCLCGGQLDQLPAGVRTSTSSSRSAGKSGAMMWLIWRVEWPAPRISTRMSSGRMWTGRRRADDLGPGRRRRRWPDGRGRRLGPPVAARPSRVGRPAGRTPTAAPSNTDARPSRTTGSLAVGRDDRVGARHEDDGRLVVRRRRSRSIRPAASADRPERQVAPASGRRVDRDRARRVRPEPEPVGGQVVRQGARMDRLGSVIRPGGRRGSGPARRRPGAAARGTSR